MRVFLILCIACLLLASGLPARSSAQGVKLRQNGKVELLETPLDPSPFFRVKFDIVNSDGTPATTELENIDTKELVQRIEIQEGQNKFHPFYVYPVDSKAENAPGRDVILLIDTSYTMARSDVGNGGLSRFQAAQAAANQLFQDFRDQVDSITIVPFDSHGVVTKIENAVFVNTKAQAQEQVRNLAAPKDNSQNTALYSDVNTALGVLEKRKAKDRSRGYYLIVLTDGKNDVKPSDDFGLMQNNELNKVVEKAQAVDITTYTIGLGSSGTDFEPEVLKRIAYPNADNYFPATNSVQLQEKFRTVQQLMLSAFRITFVDHSHRDLNSLTNTTFKVVLTLKSGTLVESDEIAWSCPYVSTAGCPASGALTTAEGKAWVDLLPGPRGGTPQDLKRNSLLYTLLILGVLSGSLAFLWFIPPRLMWPKPQIPRIPGRVAAVNVPPVPKPPVPNLRTPPPRRGAQQQREQNPQTKPRKRLDETQVLPRSNRDV
jgi:Mg-chelatase subunit ChlD